PCLNFRAHRSKETCRFVPFIWPVDGDRGSTVSSHEEIWVDLTSRVCHNAQVRVRVWLFLAAAVSAILSAGCGSIVQSTQEGSPPAHGSKMEGLAYWLPKGSVIIDGTWDKDAKNCSIKVGTLIEADTSSRWRLTRKVNHLFEDTLLLDVDPGTGLLKT